MTRRRLATPLASTISEVRTRATSQTLSPHPELSVGRQDRLQMPCPISGFGGIQENRQILVAIRRYRLRRVNSRHSHLSSNKNPAAGDPSTRSPVRPIPGSYGIAAPRRRALNHFGSQKCRQPAPAIPSPRAHDPNRFPRSCLSGEHPKICRDCRTVRIPFLFNCEQLSKIFKLFSCVGIGAGISPKTGWHPSFRHWVRVPAAENMPSQYRRRQSTRITIVQSRAENSRSGGI